MTTPDSHLAPARQAGSGFILRGLEGAFVMLNLPRLRLSEPPPRGAA